MTKCRLANGQKTVRVPLRNGETAAPIARPPADDPRAACLSPWCSSGGGGILRGQASTADHEAVTARRPQSNLVGLADAGILDVFGIPEASALNSP